VPLLALPLRVRVSSWVNLRNEPGKDPKQSQNLLVNRCFSVRAFGGVSWRTIFDPNLWPIALIDNSINSLLNSFLILINWQ
jgi:hypothetical protein